MLGYQIEPGRVERRDSRVHSQIGLDRTEKQWGQTLEGSQAGQDRAENQSTEGKTHGPEETDRREEQTAVQQSNRDGKGRTRCDGTELVGSQMGPERVGKRGGQGTEG